MLDASLDDGLTSEKCPQVISVSNRVDRLTNQEMLGSEAFFVHVTEGSYTNLVS